MQNHLLGTHNDKIFAESATRNIPKNISAHFNDRPKHLRIFYKKPWSGMWYAACVVQEHNPLTQKSTQ